MSKFYMEKGRGRGRRSLFWRIQVVGKKTTVRAGQIDRSGRQFLPREHESPIKALHFAKQQVKRKRRNLGYKLRQKERMTAINKTEKKKTEKTKFKKNDKTTLRKNYKTALKKKEKTTLKKTEKTAPKKAKTAPKKTEKKATEKKAPEKKSNSIIKTKKESTPEQQNKANSIQKLALKKSTSLILQHGKIYVPSHENWPIEMDAPLLFDGKTNSELKDAYGIYVDENRCFFGDETGLVIEFNEKEVLRRYKLPSGVKCIVRDGEFMYVGVNGGGIYDLTHGDPRLMCSLDHAKEILWLDIHHGQIGAGGDNGEAALINYEGEVIWKEGGHGQESFLIRIDDTGLYHGNSRRMTKHALADGSEIWCDKYEKDCYFGVQTEDIVYAGMADSVKKYDKQSGKLINDYKLGKLATLFCNERAEGLIIVGGETKFGQKHGVILIIDEKTKKLIYNMKSNITPLSMQYHGGRIYVVGRQGCFGCLDLSPGVIKKAMRGTISAPNTLDLDQGMPEVTPLKKVDSVKSKDVSGGVMVECVRQGAKLRVKPLSDGYNKDWFVQFPRDIRRAGAKFIVEELKESLAGGFYRAFGSIKEIQD